MAIGALLLSTRQREPIEWSATRGVSWQPSPATDDPFPLPDEGTIFYVLKRQTGLDSAQIHADSRASRRQLDASLVRGCRGRQLSLVYCAMETRQYYGVARLDATGVAEELGLAQVTAIDVANRRFARVAWGRLGVFELPPRTPIHETDLGDLRTSWRVVFSATGSYVAVQAIERLDRDNPAPLDTEILYGETSRNGLKSFYMEDDALVDGSATPLFWHAEGWYVGLTGGIAHCAVATGRCEYRVRLDPVLRPISGTIAGDVAILVVTHDRVRPLRSEAYRFDLENETITPSWSPPDGFYLHDVHWIPGEYPPM